MGAVASYIGKGDATNLPLANGLVDAIVTSPPYNLGIEYAGVNDSLSQAKYWALAKSATEEMYRVLGDGGRAFINVPFVMNLGDTSVNVAQTWISALPRAGLHLKEILIWDQGGGDGGCSWGSWLSPNKPRWRGQYESILVAYKGKWDRGRKGHNDVPREEWPELTRNIWKFPPAKKKQREHHPAPFPAELPRRCILLSTWPGDIVLDPFCGVGTTVLVAENMERIGVGFDLSPEYVALGEAALAALPPAVVAVS